MKDRKLLNIELGRLSAEAYRQKPETGIVLVLDNIRSAHNVGSAFRTADAFGVDKIYLGGICPVPPSPELHKVALGAEEVVPFEHVQDVVELTGKTFGINQDEQDSILKYLIEGGDLSKYGLSNAVTRASQDIESYDRATEFENLGWTIATMPQEQWKALNT